MAPPSLLLTPSKRTSFCDDKKPGRKLGSDRLIAEKINAQRSRNVLPRKTSKNTHHSNDKRGISYYFSCIGGGEKIKKSPRVAPTGGNI